MTEDPTAPALDGTGATPPIPDDDDAQVVKAGRRKSAATRAAPAGAAHAEEVAPPPNPQAVTMPTAPPRAPGTSLLEPGSSIDTVAELTPNSGAVGTGKWITAPCDAQEQMIPTRATYPVCRKLWSKGQTVLRSRYEAWLRLQPDADGVIQGALPEPGMGLVDSPMGQTGIGEVVTVSPSAGL